MTKKVWLGLIVVLIVLVVGIKLFDVGKVPVTIPSTWLTFTDEAGVYSFNYPSSLGYEYVTAMDWPPQVNLLEGHYQCTPGGASATARAGETKEILINGQQFCVTVEAEGAAGSTYRQYAYLTEQAGQFLGLTFTIREPQCLNYDEPRRSACQTEQASFKPDNLATLIIKSLHFTRQ